MLIDCSCLLQRTVLDGKEKKKKPSKTFHIIEKKGLSTFWEIKESSCWLVIVSDIRIWGLT